MAMSHLRSNKFCLGAPPSIAHRLSLIFDVELFSSARKRSLELRDFMPQRKREKKRGKLCGGMTYFLGLRGPLSFAAAEAERHKLPKG